MDTAQQVVTLLAHGDFAAVEERLADTIKPFAPCRSAMTLAPGAHHLSGNGKFTNVIRVVIGNHQELT